MLVAASVALQVASQTFVRRLLALRPLSVLPQLRMLTHCFPQDIH